MSYRLLTEEEINQLLSQGCFADKWSDISVKNEFSPANIWNTTFEGTIKLGLYSGKIELEKGISKQCGIYRSVVSRCQIADNVYISDVNNLANYDIEENVAIKNVGSLIVNRESAFGNGTEIEVLNEGGGRELAIFDKLSSQIAYLAVLYRHDPEFSGKLQEIIRNYSKSKRSDRGKIGTGARIQDTLIIRNVLIGDYTFISGACLLEEGTIISRKEIPTFVGEGVIAKKFIILSGSRVDTGAIIDKSFIGQSVKIGKQYSSENSLFFANSEAFHGEACSLFAGPFTVTHHKSTLLIASLFSFFNAGSGTNQSNHMYKLGPVHQGILERGSKTGSFAYLLLPCIVGAYTVVMGKHYSNFDTSDFPFSYITEEKGKSELTPAMNIFTVGTRRDIEKWPSRDKRIDGDKLDLLHFDLLNPYIIGRLVNGINILNDLAEKTPKNQAYVNHKGINIHRLLLKPARKYYEMVYKVYVGEQIIKRLDTINSPVSIDNIRQVFRTQNNDDNGKWLDICGLFSPASKIDELIFSVKSDRIKSIPEVNEVLNNIFNNYDKYAWEWFAKLMVSQMGIGLDKIPIPNLIQIIVDWKTNAVKINNMILKDAEKEFDIGSRLGFGIDGDEQTRDMDFLAVRGTYIDNKFVSGLNKEIQKIEEKADRYIALLERMK